MLEKQKNLKIGNYLKYKMVKKMKIPILEPVHYLGWAILTGFIVGFYHLVGIHLHEPWYYVVILFIIIGSIDTLNHFMGLQ